MGIKIGSEPAGYYGSVGNLLHMINKNRVGAVFISRLEQHKKLVSIYPMDAGMAARIGPIMQTLMPVKQQTVHPRELRTDNNPTGTEATQTIRPRAGKTSAMTWSLRG